ncbi:MAG: RluA family pseudouridine synthase [Bacteroidia bacterium]|nr:RluA family pseudouridine synthase [Bacteroidia bacterium]
MEGSDEEELDQNQLQQLFEHHKLTADNGQGLMRIDQYLPLMLRNVTRSKVKRAALAGCLLVNGSVVKASYRVKPGDNVTFLLPYPPPPDIEPEEIPLEIHYEDDSICIVNKSPGMVVHPGVGNHTGTLIHALLYYFNRNKLHTGEEYLWPGLIHRIDKDTSGLLIVAKDEEALYKVSKQFFNHTTQRNYNAIVWGDVKEDVGRIEGHIARSKHDRKRYMVYPDGSQGKDAVTHYEVLERFGAATLVRCTLETGRTHQIRVHMKHLGHTLVGDSFYGGDKPLAGPVNSSKYRAEAQRWLEIMPRQALHARTLGIVHPTKGEFMQFETPLPQDFEDLLTALREFAGRK